MAPQTPKTIMFYFIHNETMYYYFAIKKKWKLNTSRKTYPQNCAHPPSRSWLHQTLDHCHFRRQPWFVWQYFSLQLGPYCLLQHLTAENSRISKLNYCHLYHLVFAGIFTNINHLCHWCVAILANYLNIKIEKQKSLNPYLSQITHIVCVNFLPVKLLGETDESIFRVYYK